MGTNSPGLGREYIKGGREMKILRWIVAAVTIALLLGGISIGIIAGIENSKYNEMVKSGQFDDIELLTKRIDNVILENRATSCFLGYVMVLALYLILRIELDEKE